MVTGRHTFAFAVIVVIKFSDSLYVPEIRPVELIVIPFGMFVAFVYVIGS